MNQFKRVLITLMTNISDPIREEDLDKYSEYKVDFHGLVDHTDDEVSEEDSSIDDWRSRHSDPLLDAFCDSHPSAPQCKVYDD